MVDNVAGMAGSVLGMAAGVAILVDAFTDINFTAGPCNILLALWVFYLIIQGVGFLVLYVQARSVAAVVSSGLSVVAALELMMPTHFFLGPFVGVLTMALYTVVGGVTFVRIPGNGGLKSSHTQAGILFILMGPSILLGMFPTTWFIFPPLLVAANAVAFRVFSSLDVMTASGVTKMEPSQGVDLQ